MSATSRQLLRLLPYVLGILFSILCVRLGFWQLHRAESKAALQAQLDAAGDARMIGSMAELQEWQRVKLRGTWLDDETVYWDNRLHAQQNGYEILTPLRMSGGDVVVVDRGWTAAGLHRESLPRFGTATGEVAVTGLVRRPALGGFRLDDGKEGGQVWQRPDPAHFEARLRQPVAPFLVYQEGGAEDGLVRDWPRPDLGIDTHKGYALQWFSFATLALVLTVWFGSRVWRRSRK